MANDDWRAGTLLGSGYGVVADGKVHATAGGKQLLRDLWAKAAVAAGLPDRELPERLIKQIVFVLPPWEKP